MAKKTSTSLLIPSVLDRLIDTRPNEQSESIQSQAQVTVQLRESVRRDLENLLNTPWRLTSWPQELSELNRSIAGYGIPDVGAANLGSPTFRNEYLRIVERVVRTFEPRLFNVYIQSVDNADTLDRTLRFQIRAMLHAFPAPEAVTFDSALDPTTRSFTVEGSGA